MNVIKTYALLIGMTFLFLWAGGVLGKQGGMAIAFVMAMGMNVITYWFSDRIVLAMYRAKQVTEQEAPELYQIVASLARKDSIPTPKIYIIDQDQPNAFATGRNPAHASVAVTTGILRILSREELSGVIGHELTHVKNRDILIGTVAATIAGAISYIAHFAQFAAIFGNRDEENRSNPIALILLIIVAPIAALLIQMAISRSREYMADQGGAHLTGNPRYLSNALRKLNDASQQIPMQASPATAHMFIVNPLSLAGITALFSTHPPIEKRIWKLEHENG